MPPWGLKFFVVCCGGMGGGGGGGFFVAHITNQIVMTPRGIK